MRRFFILSGNYAEAGVGAIHADRTEFGGLERKELRKAERIHKLPQGFSLHLAEAAPMVANPSCIIDVTGMILLSQHLAEILESVAPGQIEVLEAPVFDCEGKRLTDRFFLINPLNMLDVLSEEATVRTSRPLGSIWPVVHLGICGSAVPGTVHIFRVKGWEFPVLIDDVAKEALTSVPHEGLDFGKVAQEVDI